ncbi:hypothetical protein [Bradyrhizobium sp. CCBAU 11386]|uniref:hypothetical protein n=1 Tax=Bradyrhizobium sp. CCBAU 11386 TaxID=1630837 RepID=UPI002303A523|nr:hypothetical protein [Bradyrhizobium sp. CCBAU 11386]
MAADHLIVSVGTGRAAAGLGQISKIKAKEKAKLAIDNPIILKKKSPARCALKYKIL